MPGVMNGSAPWQVEGASPLSGYDPYHKGGMSPHRRESEMRAGSRYSNGYSSDQQSELNSEGSTFLLEHLATFSVGPQFGLLSPKDGLRRLLQMEKSNGIWTQKMQLRLEKKWVVIIDYENGDVVERFPMTLISDPTSYTSHDPRELYNNILVFIVHEDPKNKSQHSPAEMHIFQCVRVSAQEVVDELKMFMTGKWKPGTSSRESVHQIPPPPSNPPPEPPGNGSVNVREQVSMFNAAAASTGPPHAAVQRTGSGQGQRIERASLFTRDVSNDETSSTSSDKYERDVAILNHCFDDIERFIARLQHAAAAYKELDRRRKTRKSKKKDMGDGMLSMRAKPPPEREFIDILQKFKLSFNLLAKLKSHIHDPNAPELVHFLFTPLALILDAARDSNYGPNVASKVVSPLLTRDSIDLLLNCCTSKESDLWHSLGDPWTIPRDQWKGYQGPYNPVFSDGWAPEYPFSEGERSEISPSAASGTSSHTTAAANATANAQRARRDELRRAHEEEKESRYGSEYYYGSEHDHPQGSDRLPHPGQAYSNNQYDAHPMELGSGGPPRAQRDLFPERRGRSPPSEFSTDSIDPHLESGGSGMVSLDPVQRQFEMQQQAWSDDLKARGSKVVQVMYPRTANNEKELTVVRGEYLEILDDNRKWWKARNIRGQVAHVPHTIVTPASGEEDIFNNPIYATRAGPPAASSPRDHYYSPSESPSGRDDTSPSGHHHMHPMEHRSSAPIPTPAPADWVRRERQGKKEGIVSPPAPPSPRASKQQQPLTQSLPPPPPPPNQPASILKGGGSSPKPPKPNITKQPLKNEPTRDLQEELKERVTLHGKQRKKWGQQLQNQNFGATYLTPESAPGEVQDWLQEKDFSTKAQKTFKDLNGASMFSLSRPQLEKYLGLEEGPRLHSHLTVQKNISGYKPFKEHELSSILEERRRKSEMSNSVNHKPKVVEKVEEPKQYLHEPVDRRRSRSPEIPEAVAAMTLSSEDEADSPDVELGSKTLRVLLREQRRKILDTGARRRDH